VIVRPILYRANKTGFTPPRMVRMWFDQISTEDYWSEGAKHLARVDPKLRKIIRNVGPCTLRPRRDYFVVLCKAIYAQQISTRVAAVLFGRFRLQFPGKRPTPALVMRLLDGDPAFLKPCGLSRQKIKYLRDLSDHFATGKIPTRRLSAMSDQEVIDALVRVHGIGRWTAEMFLMFVLNRADVLPVDDLGLRDAVREVYKLNHRPTAKELTALGEQWRPWRSLATWYLWRRNERPPKARKDG
jgi:DNA-3-methyladenine glycosylase II